MAKKLSKKNRPRRGMRSRTRRVGSSGGLGRKHLMIEPLEARLVLDSTVVFNEIMYNPPGDTDDSLEWIELYNQLAVKMDISDWSLDGAVDYTFPDGTIVPGRGYLIVAKSPTDLQAETGYSGAVLGPFDGQLSNSGEELRLMNNDGRTMNVLDYGDDGEWPVGADGSGASLVKRNPRLNSEDSENWTFSAKIGGVLGDPDGSGGPTDPSELIALGSDWSYLDNGSDQGTAWREQTFNDGDWASGPAELGYGDGGESTVVSYGPSGTNKYITTYFRHTFDVPDPADVEGLMLQFQRDDGGVVYLNGTEVARSAMPAGEITYQTQAAQSMGGGAETQLHQFTVDPSLLVVGENVIAAEVHQYNRTSSDISFNLSLDATAGDPGGPGPAEPPRLDLLLNEIPSASDLDFWVELVNLEGQELDLEGFILSATDASGGEYVFPAGVTLASGSYLVITEGQLGFHPESGERLFLYSPDKEELIDGRKVTNRHRGRVEDGEFEGRWLFPAVTDELDTEPHGTPGEANVFELQTDIVINEIMYHPFPTLRTDEQPFEESQEEWIELFNRGTTTVDLGGWELQDAVDYEFPFGTELGPGEYLVIAKDLEAMEEDYPNLAILGSYSGSLNNADERIQLVDAYNNPADELHYYEAGYWPAYADGGGSSLELRNPDSDNSKAETWAASIEGTKSEWTTYSYTGVSSDAVSVTRYNEFIFGLLDSGEFLIDDVSVIYDPTGANTEMMQNGDFENDFLNSVTPRYWRLIGNHTGRVELDPDDPTNQVLHMTASGAQQHVHDHAETTFVGNTAVRDGRTYTISFRTKWLAGSAQLHNRLFFTRLGNTVILDVPDLNGTPGAQNSTFEENLGPTYSGFGHYPILPSSGQSVTVSVTAEDPDGMSQMWVYWGVDRVGNTKVAMTQGANGRYSATLPPQSSGTIVQFYVQGTDGLGNVSTFPAAGRDSRALYKVDEGQTSTRPIDTLRVVLLPADNNWLYRSDNTTRMSNRYVGGTLIVNNEEVFYDVDVRQTGSRWIRPNSGYKIRLQPHHKFYGVHGSIRLDMKETREIFMKQMVNRAGGSSTTMYDDIAQIVTAKHGTDVMLLQLARYTDVFLDEQFENGGDGTLWELDDVIYPTGPSAEAFKNDTVAVTNQDIRWRGDNPENYRGHLLIKNNRAKDDYQKIVDMAGAIHFNGTALYEATNEIMDVDLWMRHYATQAFLGNWDTWGMGRPKNLRIYARPEDGMLIPLYWDADLGNFNDEIWDRSGTSRLDEIREIPQNLRLYAGHMWDLIERAFNPAYIGSWITYYRDLGIGMKSDELSQVTSQASLFKSRILQRIPQVNFDITSTGGSVDTVTTTIQGRGWINVREIYLGDSEEPLQVEWLNTNTWRADVSLMPGQNDIALRAIDHRGREVGSDSITIESTVTDRPMLDGLRISELMYNPSAPTPDEIGDPPITNNDAFEFIELENIGDVPLDLTSAAFTDGITYEFLPGATGSRLVVTEVSTHDDAFEIQNVSGQSINTSGWKVVVNDASGGIDKPEELVWALPSSIGENQILHKQDKDYNNATTYWGAGIFWKDGDNGWITILDGSDQIVDMVIWGYTQSEIDGMRVPAETMAGVNLDITPAGAWTGQSAEFTDGESTYLARIGSNDQDTKDDFVTALTGGLGIHNAGLSAPFSDAGLILDPGEHLVLAADMEAMRRRYGSQIDVFATYEGSLRNSGERITLVDRLGRTLLDFEYNDSGSWPGRADGNGASLVLIAPGDVPQADPDRTLFLEDGNHWQSSIRYGGTPTEASVDPVGVVINEVLSHTDYPVLDTIELHNVTAASIDIGGWYLSDSGGTYQKYQIPAGTSIPVGGYVLFDEADFNPNGLWNPNAGERGQNEFGLDGAHGDDVWLMAADGQGNLTYFADHVEFGATLNGETVGRLPNGAGLRDLYPMSESTLGLANSGPRVGPVVISEVKYLPDPVLPTDDQTALNFEFVEIYNPTGDAVDLTHWTLGGGVDFDFAFGSTLAPDGVLVVVAFDPALATNATKLTDFRTRYGIGPEVEIVGGYSGQLSDTGERVQLQRPDSPPLDEPGFYPALLEDEIRYDVLAPWTSAVAEGQSLTRASLGGWGLAADSWTVEVPSPGAVEIAGDAYEPNNSRSEAFDPGVDWQGDLLSTLAGPATQTDGDWYQIDVTQRHLTVDVTFSNAAGNIDLELVDDTGAVWLASTSNSDNEQIDTVLPRLGTWYLNVYGANTGNAYDLLWQNQPVHPGDADLSGATDLSDFNIWNAHKFTAGTDWSTGDFNSDGNTDLSDFNIWNAYKFTSAPAPTPVDALLTQAAAEESPELEAAIGELAWRSQWQQQAEDESSVAEDAVDKLLASYWP